MAKFTPSTEDLKTWAWWKKKLLKHFLPLGFLFAIIIGLAFPWPGRKVASWKYGDWKVVQTFNVCTIFVLSGLTLKTNDIVAAFKQPIPLALGLLTILGFTPMMAFVAIRLPFSQPGFSTGLAIFCTVPTTLSSGVLLVDQAHGNAALALLLTAASNLIGILTVPYLLKAVVTENDVNLDAGRLLLQLCLTILLPLAAGKALQTFVPPLTAFVRKHKIVFSMISNGSLVCIVWQTISKTEDGDIVGGEYGQLCLVVLAAITIHLVYLAFNYCLCTAARLPLREFKAVLLMGSQKTLPVTVTIIGFLKVEAVGRRGLLVVPAILGHVSQLFIDAVIMGRWQSQEEARLAALRESEESGDIETPKEEDTPLEQSP